MLEPYAGKLARTVLRGRGGRNAAPLPGGARLIEVDPRNTSQDCSGCGVKVPKDLADRLHYCSRCGLSIDRDLNAARNILDRAGVMEWSPPTRNGIEVPRWN